MHFRTSEARAERFFPIDMVREIRGGVQYLKKKKKKKIIKCHV